MSQTIVVQDQNLMHTEILISAVIEDFLLTKNSRQTVRSYRGDLVAFFEYLEISRLSALAALSFPIMINKSRIPV